MLYNDEIVNYIFLEKASEHAEEEAEPAHAEDAEGVSSSSSSSFVEQTNEDFDYDVDDGEAEAKIGEAVTTQSFVDRGDGHGAGVKKASRFVHQRGGKSPGPRTTHKKKKATGAPRPAASPHKVEKVKAPSATPSPAAANLMEMENPDYEFVEKVTEPAVAVAPAPAAVRSLMEVENPDYEHDYGGGSFPTYDDYQHDFYDPSSPAHPHNVARSRSSSPPHTGGAAAAAGAAGAGGTAAGAHQQKHNTKPPRATRAPRLSTHKSTKPGSAGAAVKGAKTGPAGAPAVKGAKKTGGPGAGAAAKGAKTGGPAGAAAAAAKTGAATDWVERRIGPGPARSADASGKKPPVTGKEADHKHAPSPAGASGPTHHSSFVQEQENGDSSFVQQENGAGDQFRRGPPIEPPDRQPPRHSFELVPGSSSSNPLPPTPTTESGGAEKGSEGPSGGAKEGSAEKEGTKNEASSGAASTKSGGSGVTPPAQVSSGAGRTQREGTGSSSSQNVGGTRTGFVEVDISSDSSTTGAKEAGGLPNPLPPTPTTESGGAGAASGAASGPASTKSQSGGELSRAAASGAASGAASTKSQSGGELSRAKPGGSGGTPPAQVSQNAGGTRTGAAFVEVDISSDSSTTPAVALERPVEMLNTEKQHAGGTLSLMRREQ